MQVIVSVSSTRMAQALSDTGLLWVPPLCLCACAAGTREWWWCHALSAVWGVVECI